MWNALWYPLGSDNGAYVDRCATPRHRLEHGADPRAPNRAQRVERGAEADATNVETDRDLLGSKRDAELRLVQNAIVGQYVAVLQH
jgi:hypothetical protein